MLRFGIPFVVLWTILLSAAPAEAQWFHNAWAGFKRTYHRNANWPDPFIYPDRENTMMPFAIQVANGVRRQNLISDYHFNENTPQLTLAGETKLRFILTQMPPQRRTIYVQRGLTSESTAMRLESVQRAAVRMSPAFMPDVVESDLPNDGTPADDIDAVAQGWMKTRPDPRLSNSSAGGGSAGGGAGGSGSGNSRPHGSGASAEPTTKGVSSR